MTKREEESVKLDLGEDPEELEFEDEEEEEEEEEVLDENEKSDVDYNEFIDLDEINAPTNQLEKTTEIKQTEENLQEELVKPVKAIKNPSKSKKLVFNEKTETIPKKRNDTEKTVFTRISEEMYHKFLNNKDDQNKKQSAYDYLINDVFLNRVVEKNDKESFNKFNDFVNRNKEFSEKKSLKLQERSEKIQTEINQVCTGVPNGKVFDKTQLRDANEYLQDQLKYYQTRDMNIKQQQEDIKKNTDTLLKSAPEISKKSKELAEKRLQTDGKEVHDRLFQEKLHKEKKFHMSEKSEKVKLPLKKSKEEINNLVEKLFKDAAERKQKKENIQHDKTTLKEVYKWYDSDDDLTNSASNLKILERFVQTFELILNQTFNKKENVLINFEEFCNILFNLGMIKYHHTLHEDTEVNQFTVQSEVNVEVLKSLETNTNLSPEEEKLKKKKQKELNLLKDAWKILSNSNEEQLDEKIDTNQLLIFCAALLGVYKGDDINVNIETVETVDNQPNLETATLNTNENVITTIPNLNTNGTVTATHRKFNSTFNSSNKKRTIMPNRFSTTMEKQTFSHLTGHSFSMTATNKNAKKIDFEKKGKENKNIIKVVLPEFDMSRYHYTRNTVKQIKTIFYTWYLNRVEFIDEQKRKSRLEKHKPKETNIHTEQDMKATIRLRQTAESFRKRIFEEVEKDLIMTTESMSQSPTTHKKKLKMEDVYDVMRKKKENEIAKYKIERDINEIKDCTFQPNASIRSSSPKNVKETVNKLYQDGVNKVKSKKTSDEKKEPEILNKDFTFAPKTEHYRSQIFVKNPLAHDAAVEKEIKRFEKARIEKKIIEVQKKKGLNNLKDLKNLDSLLVDEELPTFNCTIEKRTYKDSIDIQNKPDRISKSQVTRPELNKTVKTKTMKMANSLNSPLLNIEVNIDDTNRVEKLEIYSNDDPLVVADNFCSKYGLSEDKKLKLQKIIEEKLNENHLSSSSQRS